MKAVVVGDLAFKSRYHLGDEAMSEVALEQLQQRGFDVTFVAGEPEITTDFYGVNAVSRLGFGSIRDRSEKVQHLDAIVTAARGGGQPPEGTAATLRAVREADAIIIAGGGNLNSIGIHHVFERLAMKRLAELFGIPLFVTSQTLGPHLLDSERELVAEIANYATLFGVREENSAQLLEGMIGDASTVVRTADDAILLDPHALQTSVDLPERFIVGSFTYHPKTTGLHPEDYYREIAAILDHAAVALDAQVLLLPHMSTFAPNVDLGAEDDAYGHGRVLSYSRSGRLVEMPLLPARELLDVTSKAMLSISTRYHSLIFAASLGVPAFGIVHSYYSAVRMKGALRNVGMESFAIPFESWRSQFGDEIVAAVAERHAEFSDHLREVSSDLRAFQSRWWDAIVDHVRKGTHSRLPSLPTRAELTWHSIESGRFLALARQSQEMVNLDRLNAQLADERVRLERRVQSRQHRDMVRSIASLRAETRRTETELRAGIADVRHRQRPWGAALRDRLRLKLRGMTRGSDSLSE